MPAFWGFSGEPYEETGTWWCEYCTTIWIELKGIFYIILLVEYFGST